MIYMSNLQNMYSLSSTSRTLGRSALQSCGAHVRTRCSCNILFFSRPAMHNTPFRVTRNCIGVGHMQTMRQIFFLNLGILCQWPVPLLSADARDECIPILNSQITRAWVKNIQNLLRYRIKKYDSETVFKYLNQEEKVLKQNYVFHNLFHAISGRWAEASGAVRKLSIDNGSWHSKCAVDRPEIKKNGAGLFCHAKRRLRFNSLQCLMLDLM